MQRREWEELINRVPLDYQGALGFVTTGGVNLTIQAVLRFDDAYMMVRGRLVGTTDAGQTFFIPYEQINCMVLLKPLKDPEILGWFGETPSEGVEEKAAAAQGDAAAEEPVGASQGLSTTLQSSAPLPGKAAILERLRKRTGNSSPGTVKKPVPTGGSSPGTTPKPAAPAAPASGTPAPKPPLGGSGGASPAPRPPLGPSPRPPLGGSQNNPPPKPPEK